MITEFVDSVELKRLIQDKLLTPENVRYFYKKRGILLLSTKIDDMASQVYTILLGVEELHELQDMMYTSGAYVQSAAFEIKVNDAVDIPAQSFLDVVIDDISDSMSWPDYPYRAGRPTIVNENNVHFTLSYEKNNRGKNRLNAKETRDIRVNLRKQTDGRIFVDVRQTASGDALKVAQYLEALSRKDCARPDEPCTFWVMPIDLEGLTVKNRVDFFDRIASQAYSEWNLVTITGISIKRGSQDDDEDEDEDAEQIQEIDEDSDDLAGINQAVLNGQALRNNTFVNSCIKKNFFITSMKYRYRMKNDPSEFIVSVSSKKKHLHIDIVKSYREDDEKMSLCPYSKELQDSIVQVFQAKARDIYRELLRTQAARQ